MEVKNLLEVENMVIEKASVKYQVVRDNLSTAIQRGDFKVGQRLPAERDLATLYGVSHMTARRAVTDLVESELLERRPGSGIYVRPLSQEKLSTLTLNLICTPIDNSVTRTFIELGVECARQRGWRTRVTSLYHGYERTILRAISEGEPALILLDAPKSWSSLVTAMQESAGRSILIGNRLHEQGIPSVVADDRRAIEMAVEQLQKAGHQNIALLSNHPDHPVDRIQIETWKNCFAGRVKPLVLEKRLIRTQTADFSNLIKPSYNAVLNYLTSSNEETTALICLDAEMSIGALAACRDAGYRVPQDISVINSGDSPVLEFAHVPVSVVDVRLRAHIEVAMEMLEAALAGRPPTSKLHIIEPRFIQRQSIATVRTSRELSRTL